MNNIAVSRGCRVLLNFSLSLEDGGVVDTNYDKDAVELTIGSGDMLPGFEALLFGLSAGDEIEQLLSGEKAFGLANEENLRKFPRSQFSNDYELTTGLVVSFADKAGAELPGVITDISDSDVTVDFNHPLAGRSILFRATIHEVRPALASDASSEKDT